VDGRRVFSFHIPSGFQNGWWRILWPVRKGEHLEDTAVKSDKVLLDQLISGFQVIIEVHLQEGAKSVVTVEGKSVAIRDENEQEIKKELMVRKGAKEPISEESVLDGGKASLNRP
jgi:hypothetical protein